MANAIADEIRKVHSAVQAETAKRDVTDNYEALRRDVTELASSVKRLADAELGIAATQVQDAAVKGAGQVEASIRRNPTQAALIAAGAGFLVGLLIAR